MGRCKAPRSKRKSPEKPRENVGLIRTGIAETERVGNKAVGARRCDVV